VVLQNMITYHDNEYPPSLKELNPVLYITEDLKEACEAANIDPTSVKSVIELGCGYGRVTQALLNTFPVATIQAIDFDDRLGAIKNDPRIKFFQGTFTDVLQTGKIQPADIFIMVHMGAEHGFTKDNVQLIEKFVGNGKIISQGDNYSLEFRPWFQDKFKVIVNTSNLDKVGISTALLGWKVIQRREEK
jgi:hypothetical protein